MKSLFLVFVAFSIFSGTSLSANAQKHINASNSNDGIPKGKSIKFIEGIEIKADNVSDIPLTSSTQDTRTAGTTGQASLNSPAIENISSLQFKYAQLLNRNVEDLKNLSMYSFIDEWWETRYHYGGTSKSGIDCSAFTGMLMNKVFDIKLPRTAREQYISSSKEDKETLLEGDLVFFNTGRGVSHVGVYLGDGYFVHASRNNGVSISNLDEPYYNDRFLGGGRVIGMDNLASCR
ncbi:MAG: C40 family peptidase [Ferruginibacter sp.]